jgi:hypothetical protein
MKKESTLGERSAQTNTAVITVNGNLLAFAQENQKTLSLAQSALTPNSSADENTSNERDIRYLSVITDVEEFAYQFESYLQSAITSTSPYALTLVSMQFTPSNLVSLVNTELASLQQLGTACYVQTLGFNYECKDNSEKSGITYAFFRPLGLLPFFPSRPEVIFKVLSLFCNDKFISFIKEYCLNDYFLWYMILHSLDDASRYDYDHLPLNEKHFGMALSRVRHNLYPLPQHVQIKLQNHDLNSLSLTEAVEATNKGLLLIDKNKQLVLNPIFDLSKKLD